ncbi:CGNR zinc finger domain-containing protein [Nostocoides australiense]
MGPRDVFVDTSRQRNRCWCRADDCGNRNRVRAHNQRGRDGAQRAD